MKLIAYEYPHLLYSIPDYHGDYPVEDGAYPLGLVGELDTLIWRRRYRGVGEFSLRAPYSDNAMQQLQCGRLIGIAGRSNELYRVTYINTSEDEKGEYIEARGQSMLGLIAKRVMMSAGTYYSTVDSTVRQYILPYYGSDNVNNIVLGDTDIIGDIADANYGDRRFPQLYYRTPTFYDGEGEEDGGFVRIAWEALDNTLAVLLSACETGNCGARIVTEKRSEYADTYSLFAQLYRGTNRTVNQTAISPVIFDRALKNVTKRSFTHSIADVRTAGYVINNHIESLTGNTGRLVDIMSGNDYSTVNLANVNGGSGVDRAEIGLHVFDIPMPTTGTTTEKINALYASCKGVGKAETAKAPETRTVILTPNTNAVWPVYRTDYDIGDTVTFRDAGYGLSMDAPIMEAVETYENGHDMQLQLVLGESTATPITKMRQIARWRG